MGPPCTPAVGRRSICGTLHVQAPAGSSRALLRGASPTQAAHNSRGLGVLTPWPAACGPVHLHLTSCTAKPGERAHPCACLRPSRCAEHLLQHGVCNPLQPPCPSMSLACQTAPCSDSIHHLQVHPASRRLAPCAPAKCDVKQGTCWLQPDRHWSRIFTQRLSAGVKLVGSTISCEAAHVNGDLAKPKRQNPHVQSYAAATDQVTPQGSIPLHERPAQQQECVTGSRHGARCGAQSALQLERLSVP